MVKEVEQFVDVVEIGTPVIINEGLTVKEVSEAFPNLTVLADLKYEIDALGVDYICVHTGYDLQAQAKTHLKTIKRVMKNAKTAVAGGIKLDTLPEVISAQPDLVIVDGGITGQDDKKAVASKMQELIKQATFA